ncbi:helix-turn-helix domain-containing protein [Bartonella sp. MM73XJBT]|uniref:helix-turn-helix domain-containing protein n=1 Tax=Bartonella sp. MM73XJBT TaxID=3019095 RepID=UPI002361095B
MTLSSLNSKHSALKLNQFCGLTRVVYNRALAWQNEQYKQGQQLQVPLYANCKFITTIETKSK